MEECECPPAPGATAGEMAERIMAALWKLEEAGREAKVHLENCLALSDRMGLLKPAIEDLREASQGTELASSAPRDPALEVLLLRLERALKRGLIMLRRCGGKPYHISVSSFHRDLHLSLKQICLTVVDCLADLSGEYSSMLATFSQDSLDVQWTLQSVTFSQAPIDPVPVRILGSLLSDVVQELDQQEGVWQEVRQRVTARGGQKRGASCGREELSDVEWNGARAQPTSPFAPADEAALGIVACSPGHSSLPGADKENVPKGPRASAKEGTPKLQWSDRSLWGEGVSEQHGSPRMLLGSSADTRSFDTRSILRQSGAFGTSADLEEELSEQRQGSACEGDGVEEVGLRSRHQRALLDEVSMRLKLTHSAALAARALRATVRKATWLDSGFCGKLTGELRSLRASAAEEHELAKEWLGKCEEGGDTAAPGLEAALLLQLQRANEALRGAKVGRRAREVVREVVRMLRRRLLEMQSAAHHLCDTCELGNTPLGGAADKAAALPALGAPQAEWKGKGGPQATGGGVDAASRGWGALMGEEAMGVRECMREVSRLVEAVGAVVENSAALGELFSDTVEWSRLRKDLGDHVPATLLRLEPVVEGLLLVLEHPTGLGGTPVSALPEEPRRQLASSLGAVRQECREQQTRVERVLPALEEAVARIRDESKAREEEEGAHLSRLPMRRVSLRRSRSLEQRDPNGPKGPSAPGGGAEEESSARASVLLKFQEVTEFTTALWFGSPGDLEAAAEKLLECCDNGTIAVLPESGKYLPSAKWAKALALALQSQKGIVESAAATALVCLGATDKQRLLFGTRGTLEALVQVIGRERGPSEADGQVLSRAVFALGQLVRVEAVRDLAVDLGVPRIVVPLLTEEDLELKEAACLCLKNLSFKDPPQDSASLRGARTGIAAEGAVAPLLACLSRGTPETRVYALGCLAGLAQAPRTAIPQLCAQEVLPHIVPLLRASSAETRGYAVAAVARFDQSEGEVRGVVEAGGVPLLLELVRKGPDRCRLHALWMLSAIAGGETLDCKAVVAAQGGLEILLSQLLRCGQVGVMLLAVEVVGKLARDGALRCAMVEAGAVGALVGLLRKGGEAAAGSPKLRSAVLRLVAELCEDPAAALWPAHGQSTTILGTGGAAALLAALRAPAGDGERQAILRALVAVAARGGEAVEEMVEAGGRETLEMVAAALAAGAPTEEASRGGDPGSVPGLVEALQRCLEPAQASPTRELSFSATELSFDDM